MTNKFAIAAPLAIGLLTANIAVAAPMVSIQLQESGVPTKTIDGTDGLATYTGAYGSYSLAFTAGTGQPFVPSSLGIDLSSNDVTKTGSSTLTLLITETGLSSAAVSAFYSALIGGTLAGSISGLTYTAYADNSNAAFGMSEALGSSLSFGSGAFSGSTGGFAHNLTGLFSLTEKVVITAVSGAGQVSFDAQLSPVPLPSSAPMFGAALLALGAFGYGMKRKAKAAA